MHITLSLSSLLQTTRLIKVKKGVPGVATSLLQYWSPPATLPNWDEMWATLKQEELRKDLVKCKLDGSNNSGSNPKKEEENAALTSKGAARVAKEEERCFEDQIL